MVWPMSKVSPAISLHDPQIKSRCKNSKAVISACLYDIVRLIAYEGIGMKTCDTNTC